MQSSHVIYKLIILFLVLWLAGCQIPGTQPEVPTTSPTIPLPSGQLEPQSPTKPPERIEATETPSLSEGYERQSYLPLLFSEERLFEVVPIPEQEKVRLEELNTPQDVLKQVSFIPAGGGGGTNCWNHENDDFKLVRWIPLSEDLDVVSATNGIVFWCVCTYRPSEFSPTIELPNKEIIQAELWGSPNYEYSVGEGCALYSMDLRPDAMLGNYQFSVEMPGMTLMDEFELVLVEEPEGIWLGDLAWFAGFKPLERVNLWVIESNIQDSKYYLLGEYELTADENGMFQISFDEEIRQYNLVIEALGNGGSFASINSFSWDELDNILGMGSYRNLPFKFIDIFVNKICVASLPTRLTPGDPAKVIRGGLQFEPSGISDEYEPTNLDIHSLVNLIDGPECNFNNDGAWLWLIESSDGQVDWVMEADSTQYYLEPVNNNE